MTMVVAERRGKGKRTRMRDYKDTGMMEYMVRDFGFGGELKERRRPSLKECENTVYALRRQLLRSQETEVQKVQKSQNEREK